VAGSPLVRHLAHQLGIDLADVHGTGEAGAVTRGDVERAAALHATGRQRVTPFARRIAAELAVDLASVAGTGPGGAVREADVRRAAKAAQTRPGPREAATTTAGEAATTTAGQAATTTVGEAAAIMAGSAGAVTAGQAGSGPGGLRPAGRGRAGPGAAAGPVTAAQRTLAMRQVTARLMARSKREIPHYYLTNTVDLGKAMAWLHDRNRELAVAERIVPAALLLKAAAVAARRVPQLNGFWTDDQFAAASEVHLGVAISLRGGGLVTPAIHDAASLPPEELMIRLRDLVTRARAGRLRAAELTEATITVTNLGDQGVEAVFGVIYPPQVALVGFGRVTERAVAADGMVGVRPVVVTTLAADHRATDGYTGARYLTAISELLQRPEEM